MSKEELKIIESLENEALGLNQLATNTKLDASKLGGLLSILEINGLIKNTQEGKYAFSINY